MVKINNPFIQSLICTAITSAFAISLIYSASKKVAQPPTKPPEVHPSPEEPRAFVQQRIGPIQQFSPLLVKDNSGNRTKFTLYVFSAEYYWKRGQNFVVSGGKRLSELEMIDRLSGIYWDKEQYDALVCVGTASFDIEDNEQNEEERALKRARELVKWLRPALYKTQAAPPLYRINLGHYRIGPDSDDQRLIIIFGVKKIDPRADIDQIMSPENKEKLKQALQTSPSGRSRGFPDFNDYSKFEPLMSY